jgi:hypothetical protein
MMMTGEHFAVGLFAFLQASSILFFSAQKFGFKSTSGGGKAMHLVHSFQW